MLRTLAKSGLASGIHLTGLDSLIGARKGLRRKPLIICYHRVVRDFEASSKHSIPSILVSTRTFEDHLDWIGRHYDYVSLDELAELPDGLSSRGRPVAAITFDDGYADVHHNAVPILSRKGIPSASFVVTDLVGTRRLQLHDEVYLLISGAMRQWQKGNEFRIDDFLKSLRLDPYVTISLRNHASALDGERDPFRLTRVFLAALTQAELREAIVRLREIAPISEELLEEFRSVSWEELKAMAAQGVTIGSHTKSHVLLVNEADETIAEELQVSKDELERRLGFPIKHFAYPDGRFNTTAVNEVSTAGYHSAYTICMHRHQDYPELTIPRRVLWEKSCMDSAGRFSPAIMSCQVNGLFEPAMRCQQPHWS